MQKFGITILLRAVGCEVRINVFYRGYKSLPVLHLQMRNTLKRTNNNLINLQYEGGKALNKKKVYFFKKTKKTIWVLWRLLTICFLQRFDRHFYGKIATFHSPQTFIVFNDSVVQIIRLSVRFSPSRRLCCRHEAQVASAAARSARGASGNVAHFDASAPLSLNGVTNLTIAINLHPNSFLLPFQNSC